MQSRAGRRARSTSRRPRTVLTRQVICRVEEADRDWIRAHPVGRWGTRRGADPPQAWSPGRQRLGCQEFGARRRTGRAQRRRDADQSLRFSSSRSAPSVLLAFPLLLVIVLAGSGVDLWTGCDLVQVRVLVMTPCSGPALNAEFVLLPPWLRISQPRRPPGQPVGSRPAVAAIRYDGSKLNPGQPDRL